MNNQMLSMGEVAKRLRVDRSTVWRNWAKWAKEYGIKPIAVTPSCLRWSEADIEELKEKMKVQI